MSLFVRAFQHQHPLHGVTRRRSFPLNRSWSLGSPISRATSASIDQQQQARTITTSDTKKKCRILLGVGSNMGNKYDTIWKGLNLLLTNGCPGSVELVQTSFLYETKPMYVTNQPSFLNGVVEIASTLTPQELLQECKNVEELMGRQLVKEYQRNGPRPLDLDILYYDISENNNDRHHGGIVCQDVVQDDDDDDRRIRRDLCIPHKGIAERDFVLWPLYDVVPNLRHPLTNQTVSAMKDSLSASNKNNPPVRVIPLRHNRFIYLNQTNIMGIVNMTPDSFSGDGKYNSGNEAALSHALQLIQDGADIIDVGGESTRPGAREVVIEEELQRTIPLIQQLRQVNKDIPISIDTRHAEVARAAIEAGADIVNDVSGGTHDENMTSVVASYGNVPFIMMHMRGTPQTMQQMTNYDDDDNVVSHVANYLAQLSQTVSSHNVPRWLHIVDPGIGFAKDHDQNLQLLRHGCHAIHESTHGCPILLGPSRKRFIGTILSTDHPEDRDYGTIAACLLASSTTASKTFDVPCTILRVHNVKAMKQAAMVMDAILQQP